MLDGRSTIWLLGLASLLSGACRDARDGFRIVHPIADSLIHPISPATVVTIGHRGIDGTAVLVHLRRYADALSHPADVLSLGVANGPEALTFGFIKAARMDPFGRLLVLDQQALELRVFDRSGHLLQTLGGPGNGPGEYRYPWTLSLARSGRAAVFDGRGLVHLYSMEADSLLFLRSVDLKMPIDHGCLMGDTLVVEGALLGNDNMVHVFTLDGMRVRSFGAVYNTDNPRVREQIYRSVVECVESLQSVIVAPVFLPEVRSYALTGTLNWWVKIDGLKPVDFRENDRGLTSIGTPEGGYHATIDLSATTSGIVVQQIAFVTQEARRLGVLAGLETILLDAKGGAAIYAGSTFVRIKEANDSELLHMVSDPYPRLFLSVLNTSDAEVRNP